MSIQINTNVTALNAQRNLAGTNRRLGSLFEKLSSGMRINRAADDAAGLAISEKMRSQFRGMQQGQRNAQDGISMLQTTEGGLSEIHNILQRIRELCVQAGNTTLSASNRQAMGEELLALGAEVNNIGDRTRFNGQQLLTGALSVSLDVANSTADTVAYANGGATTSAASLDVSTAEPGATYTLSAAGAVLTLTHDDGAGFIRSETSTIQGCRRPSRSLRTGRASRRPARPAARCMSSAGMALSMWRRRSAVARCALCSHLTVRWSPRRFRPHRAWRWWTVRAASARSPSPGHPMASHSPRTGRGCMRPTWPGAASR